MTVNYTELENAISSLKPYEHGSSHAELVSNTYYVYSYSTLMLTINTDTYQISYYNNKKYSQTTSRLQTIITKVWGNAIKNQELVTA